MNSPAVVPVILGGLVLATFWLLVYWYLLYRLGRWIATRYRTKPVPVLALISVASALLTLPAFLLIHDPVWKASVVLAVWLTHTQAVTAGFWGGMELGRRSDEKMFWARTEKWLKEWEDPAVPKWMKEDRRDL